MKRLFLFLLTISTTVSVMMAASTPVMYVEYFLTAHENYLPYIEEVRSAVMDGIGLTQRFTLVDVSSQQSLQIEESRRSSLSNMPDSLSRNGIMKQLGANYILSGHLHTLSCDESSFGEDVIGYMATISLTLKIIDTSNGATVALEDIKFLGQHGGYGKNPNDAVTSLMKHVQKAMPPFINAGFPVDGVFVDTDYTIKKEEKTSCYVTMGKEHGMFEGLRLNAYETKFIAGEKVFKSRATLVVIEVVSDRLCRCKVDQGNEFLATAMKAYKKLAAVDPDNAQPIVVRPSVKEYVPDNSKALNKARVGAGSRAIYNILKEASQDNSKK